MPTPLARLFGRTGSRPRRGGDQGYGLRLAAALAESVQVDPAQPLHVLTAACRLALRISSCRVALVGLRSSDAAVMDAAPAAYAWLAGGCRRCDRRLLEEALNGRHSPLPALGDQPLWIRMGDDPFQPGTAVLRPFGLAWLLALPGLLPVAGEARHGVVVLAGTDPHLDVDHPMIRDARLVWLAVREHLAAAALRLDRGAATAWPASSAAWMAAPAALALVDASSVLAVNEAARQLLSGSVGGGDERLQGWLLGAVRRLESSGLACEVMTASRSRGHSLEVTAGPLLSSGGLRLVALHPNSPPGPAPADPESAIHMLGHELRTPLAAMKTSLDLVLRGEAGPIAEDQKRFLGTTRRNLERLGRLLGDVLEAGTKAEDRRSIIEPQTVDLGALLHDELSMLEIVCRDKGIALETSDLPRRFVACVDADKVQQMFYNVVGNAIKYTPQGGVVRVALSDRCEGASAAGARLARRFGLSLDVLTIVVEDSGLGMSEAFLATLFEPFNREDRPEARGLPGAGLGLHITRGLVEAHGGLISIASKPGRGTSVWIVLPREPQGGGVLAAGRQLAALYKRAAAAGLDCATCALDLRDRLAARQPWEIEAATEQARAFLARLGRESGDTAVADFARSAGALGWALAPGLCCGVVVDPARLEAAWQVAVAAPESVRLLAGARWRILYDMLGPDEETAKGPLHQDQSAQKELPTPSPLTTTTDTGCPPQRIGV